MNVRSVILALCLAAWPMAARAQPMVDGFNAQNHDPTLAGDRFFAAPDGTVDGHSKVAVKLTFNYADQPLKVVDEATGEVVPGGRLLKNQLYLHVDASLNLFDRVKIGLGLPFAVFQSGEGALLDGRTLGTSMSDLRAGVRVALLGKPRDAFALGAQADVWFPIGSRDDFAGDQDVRGHPRLIASGVIAKRFAYSAALGAMIRSHHDVGLGKVGTAVTYSAAAAILLLDQRLQVGPELFGASTPVSGQSPIEAILGLRACFPSLVVGLGAGGGLTRAPGAAQFRLVANVEYVGGLACGTPDSDGDGIKDPADACPNERGLPSSDPARNGCPPPDRDRDGIADADDACPDVAGVKDADSRKNGCPPDRDGDGIADADDACPDTAGVRDADSRKNGCPPDRDGDGIVDADDACPDSAGVKDADAKKNGCPPDRDGDGVVDADDACPDTAGVRDADPKKNGCPSDRDNDSIADAEDACPDLAGVRDADPKKHGCPPGPPDRDQDGIADADDACPDEAGPKHASPKKNGCPPDKDGDSVADAQDACPDKAGPRSDDPKKNGCPAIAVLRKDSIVILQQVQFDTGKATIRPASDKLLNEVAAILREHPEIAMLNIEGHTDNKGPKELNTALSQKRAEAVRDWLVKKGKVDAGRLSAQGFGPDRPIDSNQTEAGRQKNRRVEFKIVPAKATEPAPTAPVEETKKVEPQSPSEPKPDEKVAVPEPKKVEEPAVAPAEPANPADQTLAPLVPAKRTVQPKKKAPDPLAPLGQ